VTTKAIRQKQWHLTDARLEVRAETELPAGIAGRVSGVALMYDVVDTYQTMFGRGSAKRSVDGRVAARKVPLLMDHERTTSAHVGVVSVMQDVGDALVMTADVFDTPDGRAALEYVKAVIAAGASTGFSIGFMPRRSEMVTVDGVIVERFLEIEIREVSITPMPAVPGADITGARAEGIEPARDDVELLMVAAQVTLEALTPAQRAAVLDRYRPDLPPVAVSSSAAHAAGRTACDDDPPPAPMLVLASMEARVMALRASFASPSLSD